MSNLRILLKKIVYNFIVVKKILVVCAVLVILVSGTALYKELSTDNHCQTSHQPTTSPPVDPATSDDYIQLGDHEYEKGKCQVAVNNYYRAIRINPFSAEAYNNRAFVYMKLRYYKAALADLDKAIELRPEYPHALINRGDIRNYYFEIDRQKAIEDYDRVISMGEEVIKKEAVCGHRLMAKRNGNWIMATWDIITRHDDSGCLAMYFSK